MLSAGACFAMPDEKGVTAEVVHFPNILTSLTLIDAVEEKRTHRDQRHPITAALGAPGDEAMKSNDDGWELQGNSLWACKTSVCIGCADTC